MIKVVHFPGVSQAIDCYTCNYRSVEGTVYENEFLNYESGCGSPIDTTVNVTTVESCDTMCFVSSTDQNSDLKKKR